MLPRQRIEGAVSLERRRPGQQRVHHTTQRVEIRPRVDLLTPPLLRRHIGRRAEHAAGLRQTGRRVLRSRDPEVADFQPAGGQHEEVPGLQIPVHDAPFVRGRERFHGLYGQPKNLIHGQSARRPAQSLGEVLAVK